MWKHGDSFEEKYEYRYDGLNRLQSAVYSPGNSFSTNYSYDLNGNILKLSRRGDSSAGIGNMVIDRLAYRYVYNNLKHVHNFAPSGNGGFENIEQEVPGTNRYLYLYDRNGNMINDSRRNLQVEYNFLNLPSRVENTVSSESILYSYTLSGKKISQEMESARGGTGLKRQYEDHLYISTTSWRG